MDSAERGKGIGGLGVLCNKSLSKSVRRAEDVFEAAAKLSVALSGCLRERVLRRADTAGEVLNGGLDRLGSRGVLPMLEGLHDGAGVVAHAAATSLVGLGSMATRTPCRGLGVPLLLGLVGTFSATLR